VDPPRPTEYDGSLNPDEGEEDEGEEAPGDEADGADPGAAIVID
jgi:hypothetical protein